ncbi:MAG: hypothetical protein JWN30_1840 [Bacilli bacterium]|nr:hypothetical protein [Bacilli bacterium]
MFRFISRSRYRIPVIVLGGVVCLAAVLACRSLFVAKGHAGPAISEQIRSVAASVLGDSPQPALDDVEVNVQASNVEVSIKTSHFAWAPGAAGRPNLQGEGHAHLQLDNNPAVMMSAGSNYEIRNVSRGPHVLHVELVQNNHQLIPGQMKFVSFEVVD